MVLKSTAASALADSTSPPLSTAAATQRRSGLICQSIDMAMPPPLF
jgi:hypothetical protein